MRIRLRVNKNCDHRWIDSRHHEFVPLLEIHTLSKRLRSLALS